MVWAATALSAGLQSAHTADKPVFLAKNAVETATTLIWATGATPTTASTDYTDDAGTPSYPTTRLYDRNTALDSRPTDQSTDTYWVVGQIDGTVAIDSCVIKWINPGNTSASGTAITLDLADNSGFSSSGGNNAVTGISVGVFGQSDATTHAVSGTWSLNTHTQYTGATFFRIKIQKSSGNFGSADLPQISEIFLGPRRQFSHVPLEGWDNRAFVGDAPTARAKTGFNYRYVRNRGGKVFRPVWTLTTNSSYGLDDITTADNLSFDAEHMTLPFWICPEPATNVDNAFFVLADPPEFSLPAGGPHEKQFAPILYEQPPYRRREAELGPTSGGV